LYSSRNVIRVTKSRRIKFLDQVAHIGQINSYGKLAASLDAVKELGIS